jgi:hypothetical protein
LNDSIFSRPCSVMAFPDFAVVLLSSLIIT